MVLPHEWHQGCLQWFYTRHLKSKKKNLNPLLDALFVKQVDRDRLVYGALRGVTVSGETA